MRKVPDGVYRVWLRDGVPYRAEVISGKWCLADGTGWTGEMFVSEIVRCKPVLGQVL
jgi:hypothetical protein